jgi:hypothetical protein
MTTIIEDANDLRARILAGYIPSEDEMNSIIKRLIGERQSTIDAAGAKAAKSPKSSKKVDLDDLLAEGE